MADRDVAPIRRPVEWRAIPGYEGRYSITCDGRVWSHRRRIWRKHYLWRGYAKINFGHIPNVKAFFIHQLVLLTWGPPNPTNKPEANHLDGDKLNNHISNLIWATRRENDQHARDTGLIQNQGEKHPTTRLTNDNAHTIRARYTGKRGEQAALAREFGVHPSIIRRILKRESFRHI